MHRLFENPKFLAIASLTVVGQVLIVTLGGEVFKVEPLGVIDWLVIAAGDGERAGVRGGRAARPRERSDGAEGRADVRSRTRSWPRSPRSS